MTLFELSSATDACASGHFSGHRSDPWDVSWLSRRKGTTFPRNIQFKGVRQSEVHRTKCHQVKRARNATVAVQSRAATLACTAQLWPLTVLFLPVALLACPALPASASRPASGGLRQLRAELPNATAATPAPLPPPAPSASSKQPKSSSADNVTLSAASAASAASSAAVGTNISSGGGGARSCNCLGDCCCILDFTNNSARTGSCSPWTGGNGGDGAFAAAVTAQRCVATATAMPPPPQWPQGGGGGGGAAAAAVLILELSGPGAPSWSLSNANGSLAGLAAAVPGYPLQALRDAGLLGAPAGDPRSDPLYRFNELKFRWVSMDTWTLSTAFTLPPLEPESELAVAAAVMAESGKSTGNSTTDGGSSSARGSAAGTGSTGAAGGVGSGSGGGGDEIGDDGCGWDLLLEGVDTVADVLLNGRVLAQLKNFHRSYRLDVRRTLRPPVRGANDLSIVLHPAVPYVRDQADGYPYPMPSNTAPGSFGQFAFIRKPASDLGWDWGPAFAPAGVHGAVRLVRYCTPYLTGLHVVEQRRISAPDAPALAAWAATTAAGGTQGGSSTASGSGLEAETGAEGTGGAFISLTLEAEVRSPPPSGLPQPSPPSPAATAVVELWDPEGGGGGGPRLLSRAERPVGRPSPPWATEPQYFQFRMDLDVATVRLWWPVGFGVQPLYVLSGYVLRAGPSQGESPASDVGGGAGAGGTAGGGASKGADGVGGSGGGWGWRTAMGTGPQHPVSRRVGFRTVELVTVPPEDAMAELADLYGSDRGGTAASASGPARPAGSAAPDFPKAPDETFFLRVNGQPVFARGANLVPLHVLHTDPWATRPEAVAGMLAAALGAGMNMVRIWGGGRYQLDELYDMADGAGLLLWQEFMFACNPYPNLPGFREEVREEVSEQVRRLAGHPSVAIWGGNNEIEASFDWFPETRANRQLYAADFVSQFVELIREQLLQLDPGRPYVDSSPASGLYSRLPYIKRWGDPQDPAAGDVHYYNYQDDCLDPGIYPAARFVSEYGYQSFASYDVVRQYGEPAVDFTPLSVFMRHRQRHPKGEAELIASLASHFRQPPGGWETRGAAGGGGRRVGISDVSQVLAAARVRGQEAAPPPPPSPPKPKPSPPPLMRPGPLQLYQAWIYQLQTQQALCYSTALGRWRSLRSDPGVMTMGVLYWQLNDIWPGYSWSSLDYGGGWKALHSVVRRVFAPVAVIGSYYARRGPNVMAHVVNDGPQEVAVQLNVTVVSLEAATACGGANATTAAKKNCIGSGGVARDARYAVLNLTAPPQRSIAALDAPAQQVLASLPGCSESSCILLLTLRVLSVGGVNISAPATTVDGGGGDALLWPWGRRGTAEDTAVLVGMAQWRQGLASSFANFTSVSASTSASANATSVNVTAADAAAGAGSAGGGGGGRDNGGEMMLSVPLRVAIAGGGGGGAGTGGGGGGGAPSNPQNGQQQQQQERQQQGQQPPVELAARALWDWSSSAALVMLVPPKDLKLSRPKIEVYDIRMSDLASPSYGAEDNSNSGGNSSSSRRSGGSFGGSPAATDTAGRSSAATSNSAIRPGSSTKTSSSNRSNNTTASTMAAGAAPAPGSGGGGSSSRYEWCFRLRATQAPALFVRLESSLPGWFSENFILLLNALSSEAAAAPGKKPPPLPPPSEAAALAAAAWDADTSKDDMDDMERRRSTLAGSGAIGGTAELAAGGAAVPPEILYGSDLARAGGAAAPPPRVCFYTNVEVAGGGEGFRATLSVRDLYGMQAFAS